MVAQKLSVRRRILLEVPNGNSTSLRGRMRAISLLHQERDVAPFHWLLTVVHVPISVSLRLGLVRHASGGGRHDERERIRKGEGEIQKAEKACERLGSRS